MPFASIVWFSVKVVMPTTVRPTPSRLVGCFGHSAQMAGTGKDSPGCFTIGCRGGEAEAAGVRAEAGRVRRAAHHRRAERVDRGPAARPLGGVARAGQRPAD